MREQFVKEYDRKIVRSINEDIEKYKGKYHIVNMTSIITDYDDGNVIVLWESNEDITNNSGN